MLILLSLTACLVNEDLYNQRRAEVIDDDHDGFSEAQGDCDDQDRQRFPGADEMCDGEDDNCNGVVDEDPVDRTWYVDADQDGHASPDSGLLACAAPTPS